MFRKSKFSSSSLSSSSLSFSSSLNNSSLHEKEAVTLQEVEATDEVAVATVGVVVVSRVEHAAEKGGEGKVAPLQRGMGRIGLDAVPTGKPLPGNVGTAEAAAEALAAWCLAALALFLARLAGPGTLLLKGG